MVALRIEGLHVKAGDFTLEIENLEIREGELFGILGHSGAGKSTLLKIIAGLIPKREGTLWMDATPLDTLKPHERGIAYVFQEPVLFEHLSVKENLEYLLHVKKIQKALWAEKVAYALFSANAMHLMERMPDSLSGGEKQRVGIATALLFEPRLLIMDEPFAALDPDLRVQMRRFFKELVNKKKITTLFVTHDKEEAFVLFDRMALLDSGKILQVGTPKELYEKPTSLKTVKYFGLDGVIDGRIEDGWFVSTQFTFTCNKEDMKCCKAIIPPHALHVNGVKHQDRVIHQEYIEGRWKLFLHSGLVLFSQRREADVVDFDINVSKVHFLKDEPC